jgi:hypothetical protein
MIDRSWTIGMIRVSRRDLSILPINVALPRNDYKQEELRIPPLFCVFSPFTISSKTSSLHQLELYPIASFSVHVDESLPPIASLRRRNIVLGVLNKHEHTKKNKSSTSHHVRIHC